MLMEAHHLDKIVDHVVGLYHAKGERILISLAGVPGSGKTTFASGLVDRLNLVVPLAVLPQDGFHLYRRELLEQANPQEAIVRRGAPFTFNVGAFVALIARLRDGTTVSAPSFDHRLKDPVENDIVIDKNVKIVIIEGNYVSLKDDHWCEISTMVDETWFFDTPFEIIRDRIIARHLEAGIAQNEQEAIERADGSDLRNAHYILDNSKPTDIVIKSK